MKTITRRMLVNYTNAVAADLGMFAIALLALLPLTIFFFDFPISIPIIFFIIIYIVGCALTIKAIFNAKQNEINCVLTGKINIDKATLIKTQFVSQYKASYTIWYFDNGKEIVPNGASKQIGAEYYLIFVPARKRTIQICLPCDKYELGEGLKIGNN